MRVISKILRDNSFVNPVVRNLVKVLTWAVPSARDLVNRYRVFGTVRLEIDEVRFKMYSEADDYIVNNLFFENKYEKEEFLLLKHIVSQSKYFVDVGANTGVYSIYASMVNRHLQVLSFEPHPGNCTRFRRNIEINKSNRIKLFAEAAGAVPGSVELTVPGDLRIFATSSVCREFTRNFHAIDFKTIPVKQTTLDAALDGMHLSHLDLIKIDVEYYELDVLQGATGILGRDRPLVLIEILHYENLIAQFPGMKERIDPKHSTNIFKLFASFGYTAFAITQEGLKAVSVSTVLKNRNYLFVPVPLPKPEYQFDVFAKEYHALEGQ
jgi:FkbM family methyltransferase